MEKILEKIRLTMFPTRRERILREIHDEWVNEVCSARGSRDDGDTFNYNASLIRIAKLEHLKSVTEKVFK